MLSLEENRRIQSLKGKAYDAEFQKLVEELYPCYDCMYETMIDEYYMVHNEIWKKALNGQKISFLCLGCLEKRLGRNLVGTDFIAAPVNEQGHPAFNIRSSRMIQRVRKKDA